MSWNRSNSQCSIYIRVSLLVRLWVEIIQRIAFNHLLYRQPPCEAVSWNMTTRNVNPGTYRQPPCEAVSWNKLNKCRITGYKQSASLWGCELKSEIGVSSVSVLTSQPPCEAVSWNRKFKTSYKENQSQPPCEAVSWNVRKDVQESGTVESASLWGCELKYW